MTAPRTDRMVLQAAVESDGSLLGTVPAMARVEERIHIHSSVEHVWSVLIDWERQPEWMQDAKDVVVISDVREGVGVTIRCPTNIVAGLTVTDEMVVTEWVPLRRIAVRHTGKVIRGHGAFELKPTRRDGGQPGTLFTWWEEVEAPLGRVGERIASWFAVPYVSMVFRRSLRALKDHVEARAGAEAGA